MKPVLVSKRSNVMMIPPPNGILLLFDCLNLSLGSCLLYLAEALFFSLGVFLADELLGSSSLSKRAAGESSPP